MNDPRHGPRSTPSAVANMTRLLAAWREAGWPVVHVKHNSPVPTSLLRPGLPSNALMPEVAPHQGEPLFEKTSYDGRSFAAEEIHEAALANLHEEIATILTTEQVLAGRGVAA